MAAYDPKQDRQNKNPELSEPADFAKVVTANDAQTDINPYPRALYVGQTGDVKVMMKRVDKTGDSDSNGVVFPNVQAGSILPIQIRRVIATGTTASGFVALYTD